MLLIRISFIKEPLFEYIFIEFDILSIKYNLFLYILKSESLPISPGPCPFIVLKTICLYLSKSFVKEILCICITGESNMYIFLFVSRAIIDGLYIIV